MEIVGSGGFALEKDGPGVRRFEERDDAEQSGLAASVVPADAEDFPGADVQRGQMQDRADGARASRIGIGADDVFQMDQRGHGPILRRSAARPMFRAKASATSTMPSAMLRA